jgi:hypothetical protein
MGIRSIEYYGNQRTKGSGSSYWRSQRFSTLVLFMTALGILSFGFVYFGVSNRALLVLFFPLFTFGLATSSHVGLFQEMMIHWVALRRFPLRVLNLFARSEALNALFKKDEAEVYNLYLHSNEKLQNVLQSDPARFSHSRRLARYATWLLAASALSLPLLHPQQFSFGEGQYAYFIFALDCSFLLVVGGILSDRVAIKLLEVSHSIQNSKQTWHGLRVLSFMTLFGSILALMGSFVLVNLFACLSAFETVYLHVMTCPQSYFHPAQFEDSLVLFMQTVLQSALPLGVAIGAIVGAGIGMTRTFEKE